MVCLVRPGTCSQTISNTPFPSGFPVRAWTRQTTTQKCREPRTLSSGDACFLLSFWLLCQKERLGLHSSGTGCVVVRSEPDPVESRCECLHRHIIPEWLFFLFKRDGLFSLVFPLNDVKDVVGIN